MKSLCLLTLLLASTVAAQSAVAEKPCISFVPESTSPTNTYAKEPLQAAVMLSGDFEFYASGHKGCWDVHVLSLPVISGKSKRIGYAISHTVTDPKGMEVGHALTFGPDADIFVKAMHKAAADAIRNIRLARSTSQSDCCHALKIAIVSLKSEHSHSSEHVYRTLPLLLGRRGQC